MLDWHSVHKVLLIINVCILVGFLQETVILQCLFRAEFYVTILCGPMGNAPRCEQMYGIKLATLVRRAAHCMCIHFPTDAFQFPTARFQCYHVTKH